MMNNQADRSLCEESSTDTECAVDTTKAEGFKAFSTVILIERSFFKNKVLKISEEKMKWERKSTSVFRLL